MPLPRVLVTDANTTKALALVRALGPSAEVWTASKHRWPLSAWSRYVTRHLVYDVRSCDDFALWVLEACRKNEIQIVIPPEEPSCLLLAGERERFSADGIRLATPSREVLEIVLDKARTLDAAQQLQIPAPATRVLQSPDDAFPAARELGYPLVIKPRFSHYWDGRQFRLTGGVRYAGTDRELKTALRSLPAQAPPPLLQQYVAGRGLGMSVLIGCGGELCAEFAHERLRDVRPTGSGSVLRRSIPVDPRLREMTLSLLRQIGWWGVAMVEFREDNGLAYLMEINGRFWGSLQLAVDAGVNFPRILVDVLLGRPVKPPAYHEGIAVRWWLGDLLRTVRVLEGRPAGFTDSFPSRWSAIRELLGPQPPGTRSEIFRWDDPWPAVGEIVTLVRKEP